MKKQLQKEKKAGGQFRLVSLKNDKPRRIMPAPWVMQLLRNRKLQQYEHRDKAGAAWSNPMNLVFTNELGGNLIPQTVVRNFKEIVAAIGRRTQDFTISGTVMRLHHCVPEMTSRPFRATLAMPQQPLLWMSMDT